MMRETKSANELAGLQLDSVDEVGNLVLFSQSRSDVF